MNEAWQTYHDKAREHLSHEGQTHAQFGIGYALLALVEVLKPRAEAVLEMTSKLDPTPFPSAFCGDTSAHERHIWTTEDASPFSPSTSVRECPGYVPKTRCATCGEPGDYHVHSLAP